MGKINTCEYVLKLISECFYKFIYPRKTVLYYSSSKKIKDKEESKTEVVIFEQFDNGNENTYKENYNIYCNQGPEYSKFICSECKKNIIGEIFMFNDKSFCNTKCRKKSMNKLNELI